MRRKRRTKYTWLPVTYGDDTDFGQSTVAVRSLATHGGAPSPIDLFPVTVDRVLDVTSASAVLNEYIGSSLFLKRIVGKCDVALEQSSASTSPSCMHVAAGFFIARAAGNETAGEDQFPIGFSDGNNSDDFLNYSPLGAETMREPWIWRRTWTLGNNAATGRVNGTNFFPASNLARSVADGPHIDAKTARRASQDERLWFAWQVFDATQEGTTDLNVSLLLDIRLLGAVRRQKNRSVF